MVRSVLYFFFFDRDFKHASGEISIVLWEDIILMSISIGLPKMHFTSCEIKEKVLKVIT